MSSLQSGKEKCAKRPRPLRYSQQMKLNLKNSSLPRLVIGPGPRKRLSEDEVQEIYVGMCLYEFEGRTLEREELRTLTALLAGVKDIKSFRNFPQFVSKFIEGADDAFTVEVRRLATINKEPLLRKVDAVWRRHLKPPLELPNSPGYAYAGTAYDPPDMRPVGGGPSTASYLSSPNSPYSSRPAPYGTPIQPGYANVGSAYGPPDIRPVSGSQSTISNPAFPFSNPEYEQGFASGQPPQSFEGYGSPDTQPVGGGQSTISNPPFPFSNPEYEQGFAPGQPLQNFETQFQHVGLQDQPQTPGSRGLLALNKEKTPISSSSGRSASPQQAETKRQKENEKARRKPTKRDGEMKSDKQAKKKSGGRH